MKKNFFKKLSFVLVLAMIVSVIAPAAGAFAATAPKLNATKKYLQLDKDGEVGSQPCRSVSQGVGLASCLPKTAWPPT